MGEQGRPYLWQVASGHPPSWADRWGSGAPVPVTDLPFVNSQPSSLSRVSTFAVGGPVSCNQTCSTFWPLERRTQARDRVTAPRPPPAVLGDAPSLEPGERPEGHPEPGWPSGWSRQVPAPVEPTSPGPRGPHRPVAVWMQLCLN